MADPDVRVGDDLEVVVSELDELGAGVAILACGQGRLRLHVQGALPGDSVAVRIEHLSAHSREDVREGWAALVSVRAASRERVTPVCPLHGACGGCALMALAYPAQLAWKRERVRARLASYPELAGAAVEACVASPSATGYRNQAKYVYGRAEATGRLALGAFAPRSHRLVELAGCRVVEPVLDEIRRGLLEILVSEKVEPFDEQRRTGVLRYILMRATQAGQVMVTLVAARADWQPSQRIADALVAACPAVVSVVLNGNPTAGNRLLGDEERVLVGRPFVEDDIGGATVRLSSRSFFQTNREVAAHIYREIVAAAPPRVARVVDVYAGAAPIALSLAPLADQVVAIEENPAATAVAAAFIAEHGGADSRVRMVTGDAARCLAEVEAAELVVLNPPRKGCDAEVLAAVARLRPAVLAYLSCDPSTLARDLAVLVSAGARILRITPHDMMPHTPHVETLAILAMG